MSGIDWSKAPADATHAATGSDIPVWYKGILEHSYWWKNAEERFNWTLATGKPRWRIVSRPVGWNGEGLPPVGTVCEIRLNNGIDNWCKATILFCQDNALVLSWAAEGVAHATTLDQVEMRPIRTAEQIAAEKRSADLDEIQRICCEGEDKGVPFHVALYDAGYRKQVQP